MYRSPRFGSYVTGARQTYHGEAGGSIGRRSNGKAEAERSARLVHVREHLVVLFQETLVGRPFLQSAGVFLEGRARLERLRHESESDLGADVDIGGAELRSEQERAG